MELSKRIIELRKINSMTQEDLAEALGVSRQSISKWENGECLPDINKLRAIAKVFEVSIDYLINDEEDVAIKKAPAKVIKLDRTYISLLISSVLSGLVALVMVIYSFGVEIDYRTPHSGYLGFLETWSTEATIVKVVIVIALAILGFSIFKLMKLGKNKND